MKKATPVKNKKEKKATPVSMVSYSIKMVIPTGAYANIQPEIVVKAGDMETAHAFIAPHINKLWKEYYMVSERVSQPATKPVERAPESQKMTATAVSTPSPASSVALNKATQAIASCMSKEALDLISTQVEKSVKLTDEDKVTLRVLVAEKTKDFDGK